MLIELFIFFEIIMLIVFFLAFFSKNEIMWALTAMFSGILMVTSYNVETYVYKYNNTLLVYQPLLVSNSYPYLMGINMAFFLLTLALGIFDLFDKYGGKYAEEHEINNVTKK